MNSFCGNQLVSPIVLLDILMLSLCFQAITCKFCKNEAFIKMEKPKKNIKQKVTTSMKLKKKRKKDKFCGLKQEAVLSLTTKKKRKSKLKDCSSEVMQLLTPKNIRSLDYLGDREYERPKLKLMKTELVKISEVSKENLTKSKHKLKKKRQQFDKLNDILKKPNIVNNSVSSLKNFLQSL